MSWGRDQQPLTGALVVPSQSALDGDALQYPGRTLHEEWPQLGPTNNTCLDSVLSITLHDHHPIHPSLPITLQDRLGLAILYYIITIYSNLIYIFFFKVFKIDIY